MEKDEEYYPEEVLGMHEFLCYREWGKKQEEEEEELLQIIPLI